jgi:Tfp pilus assembly protein PilF
VVRLLRGDDGNALRILKSVRSKAAGSSTQRGAGGKRACQAEVALSYAYMEMGRFEQARYALVCAVQAARAAGEPTSIAVCAHLFEKIAEQAGVTSASRG